jgi:hypothetical protein
LRPLVPVWRDEQDRSGGEMMAGLFGSSGVRVQILHNASPLFLSGFVRKIN